ncbi:hypothetical protein ABRY23_08015 [Melioribacteraceae bacterium 4301-Me]|uniref:hypothetical protein n=1 Tax=Pyranulibacter aquaticus TaxID=3163344 RepID=UPI0035964F12
MLLFEPQINFRLSEKIEPKAALFIDNSKSISVKDSISRSEQIKRLIEKFSNELSDNIDIYSFGKALKKISNDSIAYLKFNEAETNFSSIASFLTTTDSNFSSAVIVSDGIMTAGNDPTYTVQKLGIPIFTVAVGDTIQQKDISVKNVLFNQYIYANKTTTLEATILNYGFASKETKIALYEGNQLIESKEIALNENGVNVVKFNYTPKSEGEKKLTMQIAGLPGEISTENNKYIFYVNVLNDKIKILLISSLPSADVSIIHQSLSLDENFLIKSIIEVAPSKFLINPKNSFPNDSADVILLVNFPSQNSTPEFFSQVSKLILTSNKPIFMVISSSTDLQKLKSFEQFLPFKIGKTSNETVNVQPKINESNFTTMFSADSNTEQWENLPPVIKNNSEFLLQPGSIVLATAKINNIITSAPLIAARSTGSHKSIAILAGEIWKWKLLTAEKGYTIFDSFLNSSIKWLYNQNKEKQLIVRTSKKLYALGETVDFTTELYDQTFTPIENAKVKINIKSNTVSELTLDNLGNGIYTGNFLPDNPGDYEYTAEASFNNIKIKSDTKKFSVGEVDIEKMNTKRNDNFLKILASETNGKFYDISNVNGLFDSIKKIISNYTKEKLSSEEIILWSNKWILYLVILLFAVEWFMRKRLSMI